MLKNIITINIFFVLILTSVYTKSQLKVELVDEVPHISDMMIDVLSPDSKRFYSFTNDGRYPEVHRSDDGGANWYSIWSDDFVWGKDSKGNDSVIHIPQRFNNAACPDTGFCIAFTDSSTATSTNGGFTWSFRKSTFKGYLYDFQMLDDHRGVGVMDNRYIYITSDTCKHWNIIDGDSLGLGKTSFFRVNILKNGYLFLYSLDTLGNYYSLFKSPDFGKTWQKEKMLHNVFDMKFTDTLTGWAISDDKVYKTADGGKSWIKQVDTIFQGIISVSALNPLNAVASSNNAFFVTTDGGALWNIYRFDTIHTGTYKIMYVDKKTWLFDDLAAARVYRFTLESDDVEDNNIDKDNLSLFPNPLYSGSELTIQIPQDITVIKISLYNSLGSLLGTHVESDISPGQRTINYKPAMELSSGTYWIRVEAGKESWCKPLILIKN